MLREKFILNHGGRVNRSDSVSQHVNIQNLYHQCFRKGRKASGGKGRSGRQAEPGHGSGGTLYGIYGGWRQKEHEGAGPLGEGQVSEAEAEKGHRRGIIHTQPCPRPDGKPHLPWETEYTLGDVYCSESWSGISLSICLLIY